MKKKKTRMSDNDYYNEVDHIIKMLQKDTEYSFMTEYLQDMQLETLRRYYAKGKK